MRVDDLKTEAGNPQDQPEQGSLIGQFGTQGRPVLADRDLAVVEPREQRTARLAGEMVSYVSGRIELMPRRVQVQVAASVPGGRCCVIALSRVSRDLGHGPRSGRSLQSGNGSGLPGSA